jgi:hypothetical protein
LQVSRALERFKAVHKKGYHMVHCWEKLKDAQKWKTSFAAYDEVEKNGTAVTSTTNTTIMVVKPFHFLPEAIRLPRPI